MDRAFSGFGPASDLLAENVVSQLSDALIGVDAEHRVRVWSKGAQELYGYTQEEVIGQPLKSVTHYGWLRPDDEQEAYDSLLKTGVASGLAVHLKKDGSEFTVEFKTTVIKDAEGRTQGMVALMRDVSERERSRIARSEAEQIWRQLTSNSDLVQQLIDHAPFAVWAKDEEGRYIFHNSYVVSIHPNLAHSAGKTDEELFDPAAAASMRASDMAALRSGDVVRSLEHTKSEKGQHSWLSIKFPVTRESKRYLAGLAIDVTAQFQKDRQIAEQAQLLDAANDAIIVVSSDSIISYWNNGASRLYGYSAEQAIGRNVHALLGTHVEQLRIAQEELARGQHWQGELLHRNRRGEPIWAFSRWTTLRDAAGNATGRLEINTDITEQKIARQALAASEERFRTSVETCLEPFGIYSAVRDKSGRIVDFRVDYVNSAACDANRLSAEQQIGKTLCELLPGHRDSGLLEHYMRVVETGEPFHAEDFQYRDRYEAQEYSRVFDIRASKLGDGFVAVWRDVTERSHATAQAAAVQEHLSTALLSAKMCSWDWNMITGDDQFFGDTEAIFGANPGSHYSDFLLRVHPEDREAVEATLAAQSLRLEPYADEFRVVHPDGAVHWIRGQGRFFHDENGTPVRMVGLNVDITEQKNRERELTTAKAELEKQRSLLQTIVDNIPVMLCYMRETGKVDWVNKTWEKLLGWTERDNGGNIANLLYPDPEEQHRVRDFISRAEGQWGEFRTATKSGKTLDTAFVNVKLPDGTNIGIGQDITDRKLAEQRFRLLAETIPQLVWLSDHHGHTFYYNQRWYEYTGQTEKEAEGAGWQMALHPEDRAGTKDAWDNAIAGRRPYYEAEYRLRRHDGEYRWFLARGIPLRDAGTGTLRWFGTCTDISDQKLAQEALIRAEKLSAAGRLAATVAHEINNPLAAVTNIHFLLSKDTTLPERAREYLSLADRELERVTHTVRQTLSFYKEHASPEQVSLALLVHDVMHLYGDRLANRGVRVQIEIDDSLVLRAVPGEVRQVLSNLVANSMDALTVGGQLRIRARLHHSGNEAVARISVADTGVGIPPEVASHIFEPFYTTKADIGTGLGLYVAKKLIEKHQGRIRVRSRPGSGTIFTIVFPMAASAASEATAAPAE